MTSESRRAPGDVGDSVSVSLRPLTNKKGRVALASAAHQSHPFAPVTSAREAFRRLTVIPVLLCVIAGSVEAADWPQWRGPQGNGHVPPGEPVPASLPRAPRHVWKQSVGFSLGSPVVSGGIVYHLDNQGDKEVVHALETATGKERWKVVLDDVHKDYQSPPGPRSTPTVDGDRVYVQSCRGEFRCLALADGKTIWRVNFVTDFKADYTGEKGMVPGASRHGYTSSPFIDGEHLLVAVGGQEGASIVCFNKRSGRVIWKSQDDIPGYGGPVVANLAGVQHVVAFMAEAVIGLRRDNGALLWRVPVKTSYGRHAVTPLVWDDLVIVGSHLAGTMALKIARQGDRVTADTAWNEKRIALNISSPVLVGDHVYGLGPAGMLFCADARTGKETWSVEVSSGANARAQIVVLEKNLLVLTDAGELLLIPADPAAGRIAARAKVCGETWSNPAFADGRLYLRDKEHLLCLELGPARR